MRVIRPVLFAALLSLALGSGVSAQNAPGAGTPETPVEFKALKYRSIGPSAGGRVVARCGVPGRSHHLLCRDRVRRRLEVDRRRRHVEADLRRSADLVDRVDRGRAVGPERHLRRLRRGQHPRQRRRRQRHLQVDRRGQDLDAGLEAGRARSARWSSIRRNPDIAFAAVLGHAFGPNTERGVYRTLDGGKTWERVLTKDEDTGASDVAIDPTNPEILFAGFWQARRRPWELTAAARAAACTSRATAARPGRRSPATGCLPASGARSASRSRRRTAGASTR